MIFYWSTWSSVKLPTRKVAKSIQLLVHGLNYFKEFHEDRFFVPCCLIFTSMILFSALNDTDICDFADNKKVYKHFAHFIHIWDLKKKLTFASFGVPDWYSTRFFLRGWNYKFKNTTIFTKTRYMIVQKLFSLYTGICTKSHTSWSRPLFS